MRTNSLASAALENKQINLEIPDRDKDRLDGSIIIAASVSAGMNTLIDPADLQDSELTVAKNVIIANDRVRRRPALIYFKVIKPNANKVLGLFEYKLNNGTNHFVRFSKDTVHYASSSTWNVVTGAALTGTDDDKFRVAVIDDRLFFTNNGVAKIQELNVVSGTYAPVGNGDSYRFITAFGDRLVGAWLTGGSPNPTWIGWSGDRNYGEWNPAVDISAGAVPLVESSSNTADFISGGIYGFSQYMAILRERSLWFAGLQPSATDPFSFRNAFPGVGCDMPDAVGIAGNGLIFPDRRTENIYVWNITAAPQAIADKVSKSIFQNISEAKQVFGAFSPATFEYYLAIPYSDYVKVWKYNFRTQAWSFDEMPMLSVITAIDKSGASVTIDELTGTIDSLSGTIDSLSDISDTPPTILVGTTNGEILVSLDGGNISDDTGPYETELGSKSWHASDDHIYLNNIKYTIVAHSEGTITLEYSSDDGATWDFVRNWVITYPQLYKPLRLHRKRLYKTERFMWKISTSDCHFELIEYKQDVELGGLSR